MYRPLELFSAEDEADMTSKHGFGGTDGYNDLAVELLHAKADNLERLGRRLRDALLALKAFDAVSSAGAPVASERCFRRQALLAAAGEALWFYAVQREVSGLRDLDLVLDDMAVPAEVRLRMGPAASLPRG